MIQYKRGESRYFYLKNRMDDFVSPVTFAMSEGFISFSAIWIVDIFLKKSSKTF